MIKLQGEKTVANGHITVSVRAFDDTRELPTHFSVNVNTDTIADRLVRAIDAGVAYTNPRIVNDPNGDWVNFDHQVMGRYLNADLTRLGF